MLARQTEDRIEQDAILQIRGAPPQFLSTHPAGESRIRDIQGKLPKVQPLFAVTW